MAETVELSRGFQRRAGVIGGLVATLRQGLARLSFGRAKPLQVEEWPDYLLRDIGLERKALERTDPRALPTDWLAR